MYKSTSERPSVVSLTSYNTRERNICRELSSSMSVIRSALSLERNNRFKQSALKNEWLQSQGSRPLSQQHPGKVRSKTSEGKSDQEETMTGFASRQFKDDIFFRHALLSTHLFSLSHRLAKIRSLECFPPKTV